MKRSSIILTLLIVSLAVFGHGSGLPTDDALLHIVCGNTPFGTEGPGPDLISELRAAAANALSERVLAARGLNTPLAIDDATVWEQAAASGVLPECRALGPLLLPQIYVDGSRADNPFASDGRVAVGQLALALEVPTAVGAELGLARTKALIILCRGVLFGGAPADIIARLETVANGGVETIGCGGPLRLNGGNPSVRAAIADSLKGAYLAQLGPITFAPGEEDPEVRAAATCEALINRVNNEDLTDEARHAAAEAYVQGNARASLPARFSYECVAESEFQAVADADGFLAEAVVDLLAKALAASDVSDAALTAETLRGASPQARLAAGIALGIRNAGNGTIDPLSGNVVAGDTDLVMAASGNSGLPLGTAHAFTIAQTWAGRQMDTAGQCVLAGGLADCIITR